ncbi:uncharacterized protein LOC108145303 [Drosophila elegans]|uniref:uncharacterized protein LOC108145303 n=1 Tax=Drosophila elegans TaxID=30023 RepID=UPI0007E5FD6C|nr:uncharacterized protein LOC108145303 [Drosophila elegans]
MIIDNEPNFTPKNQQIPQCYEFSKHSCRAGNPNSTKSVRILQIIFYTYFCHTIANIIDVKKVKHISKRLPCTKHISSKLTKFYTRPLKYSQIWLIFVLLLPTQQQVSGHGMFRQTSSSNESPPSHKQETEHVQTRISPLKSLNEAESLKNNQLQSKTKTKISSTEKVLNSFLKNISKQSRDSFYNVSSNKYSLNNISQSNHMPHTTNQKIAFEWKDTAPVQNRQKREARDIQLEASNHNNQPKQVTHPKRVDEARLKRLVLKGLGMKKIPDMRKVNISQDEYANKYIEYLNRLRSNQQKGTNYFNNYMGASSIGDLNFLSIVTNKVNDISHRRWRHKRSLKSVGRPRHSKTERNNEDPQFGGQDKTNILLHFPLTNIKDAKIYHDKIDEANVRLMLLYSSSLAKTFRRWQGPKKRKFSHTSGSDNAVNIVNNCNAGDVNSNQSKKVRSRQLNLKVYQLLSANRRRLLASRKIEFENIGLEETRTQWIEFDVTKAVRGWLNKSHENLGIEIQCDRCKSVGARILSDSSPSQSASAKPAAPNNERFNLMPVLNIIGHGSLKSHQEGDLDVHHIMLANNRSEEYVHHRTDQDTTWRKDKWNNNCYKMHQRCCRNQLDVAFKDIKGFEFILQPKVFDAGYCHGRCPPRHNPAHHHALLQSLIWQEDHSRAPRPCCAPSKLEMLEILHVDEDHSDKLKISTWSDMQVVECACS